VEPAERALRRAQALIDAERFDGALEILAQFPEEPEAILMTAIALASKAAYPEALVAADRSIALLPEEPQAHATRASALLALGRFKPALTAAQEAVRLSPRDPAFHAVLAWVAITTWNRKVAEPTGKALLELAPEWTVAHDVAGAIALRWGSAKVAEAHFRDAIRLDPMDARAINDLALAISKQGRRQEAIQVLETAARANPLEWEAQDNLYLEVGRYIRGMDFGRLELWVLAFFLISFMSSAAIFWGWIRPPAAVQFTIFVLTLVFGGVYVVVDTIGGLRRRAALSQTARAHHLRRFRRDYRRFYGFVLYMTLTLWVPAAAIGIAVAAAGLSEWVGWAGCAGLVVLWVLMGPRFWFKRVRHWVVSET
jgi:tetratricopeptide (TPR) repeat protein